MASAAASTAGGSSAAKDIDHLLRAYGNHGALGAAQTETDRRRREQEASFGIGDRVVCPDSPPKPQTIVVGAEHGIDVDLADEGVPEAPLHASPPRTEAADSGAAVAAADAASAPTAAAAAAAAAVAAVDVTDDDVTPATAATPPKKRKRVTETSAVTGTENDDDADAPKPAKKKSGKKKPAKKKARTKKKKGKATGKKKKKTGKKKTGKKKAGKKKGSSAAAAAAAAAAGGAGGGDVDMDAPADPPQEDASASAPTEPAAPAAPVTAVLGGVARVTTKTRAPARPKRAASAKPKRSGGAAAFAALLPTIDTSALLPQHAAIFADGVSANAPHADWKELGLFSLMWGVGRVPPVTEPGDRATVRLDAAREEAYDGPTGAEQLLGTLMVHQTARNLPMQALKRYFDSKPAVASVTAGSGAGAGADDVVMA